MPKGLGGARPDERVKWNRILVFECSSESKNAVADHKSLASPPRHEQGSFCLMTDSSVVTR